MGTGSHYNTGGKKMNILFLLKSLNMGGVEIVTAALANKFVEEGHNVCIFSFFEPSTSMRERIDERVTIYQLRKFALTDENVQAMRAVMKEEKIQIVINQWGLPVVPIKVAKKAAKGLGIKIITVYHNMPNANGRVQKVDMKLAATHNPIKRSALKIVRKAFEFVTGRAMRYNYQQSDRYMVLSPSFVDIFANYAGIKDKSKLVVQTNPVTIVDNSFCYDAAHKEKELLYVGRIDTQQKRVERVIDAWERLHVEHPDWRLTIVGDGETKEELVKLAKVKGLPRISFEGFQNPRKYYERASLLILTSDYEGYGLVLVEGMHFGVVPVVYGSYPAVYDIITDGKDGRIIQPTSDGQYDGDAMVKALTSYMNEPEKLKESALTAIATSGRFSIDEISRQWNALFNEITRMGGALDKDFINGLLNLYNPSKLGIPPYEYNPQQKEKEILFVGRIDLFQKHVERVIATWSYLEKNHPDWKLTIIGDGPDRVNVEQQAKLLGLQRITFEGFQQPTDYYRRASILILTSEFEGFPLVLAEAMSFGVVPAVYDSYAAAGDIVKDGINGLLIPYDWDGFKAEKMAERISAVMRNEKQLNNMALKSIETSKEYSIDTIYKQWIKLLNSLLSPL